MIYTSAEEAVKAIRSGDHVFIHTAAAAPQQLIKAMSARSGELRDVQVYHLHTEGDAPYAAPGMEDSFRIFAFFVGKNVRDNIQHGAGSYIPCFLSEVPQLIRSGTIELDVALVTVSPPDKHGFCSLGVSIDTSCAAVRKAKHVIAQVNENMPRAHGDGIIHVNDIDALVEGHDPLPETKLPPPGEVAQRIGNFVAGLIEDGSTLQMGIGEIPNAVLAGLENHKHLGIHTEMFSDGILPLVKKGVIDGSRKKKHPGKIVASFAIGTRKLFDFMDDNPQVAMLDSAYVNNTEVIRQNPKVVAINSAIEIDLTGQVCADSIGGEIYSGVGGQMDFIRGASKSEGGKPIIALPSVTKNGISRITRFLKEGAGVVTTRAHVHYVATEWGVVNLYGKTLKERAKALIGIAHPDHREALEQDGADLLR